MAYFCCVQPEISLCKTSNTRLHFYCFFSLFFLSKHWNYLDNDADHNWYFGVRNQLSFEKSHIRETTTLSKCADSIIITNHTIQQQDIFFSSKIKKNIRLGNFFINTFFDYKSLFHTVSQLRGAGGDKQSNRQTLLLIDQEAGWVKTAA